MKADTAFNKVTSHIISLLEDDIIPWRKPFNVSTSPINGASKHEYSGVNAWLLRLLNFDEPFFFGFKDRKSTRLNSSHVSISYAVFCLKKKKSAASMALYE